jgi:hypothetical protein
MHEHGRKAFADCEDPYAADEEAEREQEISQRRPARHRASVARRGLGPQSIELSPAAATAHGTRSASYWG